MSIIFGCVFYLIQNFSSSAPAVRRFVPHILFLTYACVALSWAPSLSFGLRTFLKLVGPFLFVLVVYGSTRSAQHVDGLQKFIVRMGLFVCLVALLSTALGLASHQVLTWPNVTPALFSAFLLVPFSISFCRALCAGGRHWLVSAAFSVCILASVTRITIAAMFVSAAIAFALTKRGAQRFIVPLAVGAAGILLFLTVDRFKEEMFLNRADDVNVSEFLSDPAETGSLIVGSGRFEAWDVTLHRFYKTSPIFGSGIGATQKFFYESTTGHIGVIHSEVVRILCELGSVGLVLWFSVLFSYAAAALRCCGSSSNSQARSLAIASVCAVASYTVFMLTDNAIDYVTAYGNYVFGLVALCLKSEVINKAAKKAATANLINN